MTIHNPAYYRDILKQIEEAIELEEARFDSLKQLYVPRLEQIADTINIPADVAAKLKATEGESFGEKLFNWIANQDPGKNYPATQWMLDRVLRKQNPMPLEDLVYARETLEKFAQAIKDKTLPADASKDLNRYKSLSDIDSVLRTGKAAAQDVAEKDLQKARSESTIFYDGPDLMVLTPKTQFAACFWGQPTNWCTAYGNHLEMGLSRQGQWPERTNQYDYHNKQGPLYIVINKQDPEERYQFHYPTNQFMDIKDKGVDPKKIAEKFPKLWKIFQPIAEENKSFILNANPSEETKQHVISKSPRQIKYLKDPSPELQLVAAKTLPNIGAEINNPTKEVQLIAVKNNGLNLIQISDNLGKDPDEDVQIAAVKNDGLGIKGVRNPSEAVQRAAVEENGDALRFIIENLGGLPSMAIQKAAVANAYDALTWIDKPSEDLALYAIEAHKDSPWAVSAIGDILAEKKSSTARTNALIKRYERG